MVMSPTVLSEQILMDCIHEEHNIFKINYAKELKEMTCASQAELAAVNEASLKEMWSSCVKFVEGIIKKIGELVEAGIGKITIAIGQMERNAKAIKTALSTGKWKEQKVEFKIRSIRKDKIDKMTISSFAGLNRAAIDKTKEVNKDEITRNLWKTVGRTYSESMSMQDAIIDEYTSDVDYALTDSSSVSTYLDDMIAGKSVIGGLRKSYSIVKSEFAKIVNDAKKAANNVSEDAESYKYAKNAYTIATMESAFYTSWFKTMISVVTSCLISENNSIMKVAKKCMGHTAAADKKQSNNQQAVNASAIEGEDNMISTVQHEEQFDDTKNKPEGWNNDPGSAAASSTTDGDKIDESALDEDTREALKMWGASVLEAEFIEPTKSADAPDESSHPIEKEVENYDHDPANDHSGEDFMKDAGAATLEIESALSMLDVNLLL